MSMGSSRLEKKRVSEHTSYREYWQYLVLFFLTVFFFWHKIALPRNFAKKRFIILRTSATRLFDNKFFFLALKILEYIEYSLDDKPVVILSFQSTSMHIFHAAVSIKCCVTFWILLTET